MMLKLLFAFAAGLLVAVPVQAAMASAGASASAANDRAARRTQSQIDKLERTYERHIRRCSSNDENACSDARDELAQIQGLKAAAPSAAR